MITPLLGTSFIGYSRSTGTKAFVHAVNPATGEKLEPLYLTATEAEVEKAMSLAAAAFPVYANLTGKVRAEFLRNIAREIEVVADDIAARGQLETGLPEARLRGETARTTGQLRMFADLIEDGSWVDARIERADPDRKPIPKVDLRSMSFPLGPVAVFCASNFPMAYSVAGGDSASALAAGCPVIVIAHNSHVGVAEIVASAVIRAAKASGMPEGVFSVLYGGGRVIGQAVVKHPVTQAVGFTGSRAGGTALMDIASDRKQPIPVYAEMSAVNPVVILPSAVARGEEALAESFFGSLTLGVGQFCTNPGLVFLPTGLGEKFLTKLKSLVEAASPGTMLNATICKSYAESTAEIESIDGVTILARGSAAGFGQGSAVVFTVPVDRFVNDESLQGEMFGPATLIVRGTLAEIEAAIPHLEGQLTASIHGSDAEIAAHPGLVAALRERSGRMIYNGYPTGVEVCSSMVHGGPFPATSDGRSTSVGSMAIDRFCRAAAWQSCPDALLPPALQDANPLGLCRMENGRKTRS